MKKIWIVAIIAIVAIAFALTVNMSTATKAEVDPYDFEVSEINESPDGLYTQEMRIGSDWKIIGKTYNLDAEDPYAYATMTVYHNDILVKVIGVCNNEDSIQQFGRTIGTLIEEGA